MGNLVKKSIHRRLAPVVPLQTASKSSFKFGVYAKPLVWIEKLPPRPRITNDPAACFARDLFTAEEEEMEFNGELDEVNEAIKKTPVYSFTPSASKYPGYLISINDMPKYGRKRPKCKVAVCLLLCLSGYTRSSFKLKEIDILKQLLTERLIFLRFHCVRSVHGREVRTTRRLQSGDIQLFLRRSMRLRGNAIIKSNDQRLKLGLQIWVKYAEAERVASNLFEYITSKDFDDDLSAKLPKLVALNTIYAPDYLKQIALRIKDNSAAVSRRTGDGAEVNEYDISTTGSIISQNSGCHLWQTHLKLLGNSQISKGDLENSRGDILRRNIERIAAKKQLETIATDVEKARIQIKQILGFKASGKVELK